MGEKFTGNLVSAKYSGNEKRWGKAGQHILFWFIFLLLWSAHDLNYHRSLWDNLTTNMMAFIPYSILVYVNLYVLMPKLLLQRKFLLYAIFLLVCVGAITIFTSYYLSYYFRTIDQYLPTSYFFASMAGKIAIAVEVVLALCLSMTLFLIDAWYRKDRLVKDIERKQLETELSLLKNQINPHFLFNSLNSIYIMLGRNLEKGKNMLLQFSDILSHQLYDANKKSIPLSAEFENLRNYIGIEKIRHEDLVTVDSEFPEHENHLVISPMLLLPLVENAFKHGQSSSGYWIRIKAGIVLGNTLDFTVENTISKAEDFKAAKDKKGIGLANVKRRLELIYPNRHVMNIGKGTDTFSVHLRLQLYENAVFNN